ncbi:hypothetical protein [Streptomyces platensis]|uniref:hypothetical protein n=1 Tax=Streptomyces platensis TaxID=58346 RepID=UPI001F2DA118|nr:hypothetical protein [Streptomyces platensis]MCF3143658.1 hypothetical protein [Streptomyces platensis]
MRKAGWTVLGATVAGLVTGCTGSPPAKQPPAGDSKPKASQKVKRELPEGMHRLGQGVTTEEGSWKLTPSALTQVTPTSRAKGLPRGWRAAKMTWTLTNKTGEVQQLLDLSPTVRYGAMGRPAAEFTDTGIKGIPDAISDDPPRVKPGGAYTLTVGVAVPADAAGEPVTLTTRPTTMFGDTGDVAFFEGPFPGAPARKDAVLHPRPAPETRKTLAFGQWKADPQMTVDHVRPEGTADGRATFSGELTVRNTAEVADLPYTPMKKSLRVYYGDELKEADLIPGGAGAADTGFIAPQRAATHTFHFSLPKGAKAESVTVEVTDLGSTEGTFEGKIAD